MKLHKKGRPRLPDIPTNDMVTYVILGVGLLAVLLIVLGMLGVLKPKAFVEDQLSGQEPATTQTAPLSGNGRATFASNGTQPAGVAEELATIDGKAATEPAQKDRQAGSLSLDIDTLAGTVIGSAPVSWP